MSLEQNVGGVLCSSLFPLDTHTHSHPRNLSFLGLCLQAAATMATGHLTLPFMPEPAFTHHSGPPSPPADPSQATPALPSALFHICSGSHRP